MTLRPASRRDISTLMAIEQACFASDQAWEEELFQEELETSEICLAEAGGAPVGYTAFLQTPEHLEIDSIAVHPDHRRRGYAQDILELLHRRAPGGVVRLEVSEVNRGAISLYQRCGYREIGRVEDFYPDGTAAILMERRPQG